MTAFYAIAGFGLLVLALCAYRFILDCVEMVRDAFPSGQPRAATLSQGSAQDGGSWPAGRGGGE